MFVTFIFLDFSRTIDQRESERSTDLAQTKSVLKLTNVTTYAQTITWLAITQKQNFRHPNKKDSRCVLWHNIQNVRRVRGVYEICTCTYRLIGVRLVDTKCNLFSFTFSFTYTGVLGEF